MDLAGKLPTTSSRGNKYVFLWYEYDSNTMKSVPINRSHQEEQLCTYGICYEYYALRGSLPQVTRLDNKASTALKKIKEDSMEFQFVPPNIHHQNSSEGAMRTWKEHTIATLSTFDPEVPLYLWC